MLLETSLIVLYAAVANANFIAYSGNRCDGAGGSVVSFLDCTNLQDRHSFKFVDSLPFSPKTYMSFWAKAKCVGNENGYKNPKLNQCYNINTGGNVQSGKAFNYCHVANSSIQWKTCADLKKHAVSRDNGEALNDTIVITPVDDSDSEPIYLYDNYEYGFNETIERLKAADNFRVYKTPFNESSSENEGTNVPKWLFNQLVDLASN